MTIVWIFALVFVIVVVSFLLSDFARRDGNPPSCHRHFFVAASQVLPVAIFRLSIQTGSGPTNEQTRRHVRLAGSLPPRGGPDFL